VGLPAADTGIRLCWSTGRAKRAFRWLIPDHPGITSKQVGAAMLYSPSAWTASATVSPGLANQSSDYQHDCPIAGLADLGRLSRFAVGFGTAGLPKSTDPRWILPTAKNGPQQARQGPSAKQSSEGHHD